MEKGRISDTGAFDRLRSTLDGAEPVLTEGNKASVAVVLAIKEKEIYVLFIKRAERDSDAWSGHVAFPGGHRDAVDCSYRNTAERETMEELGFDLGKNAEFLGYCKPTKTHTGNIVVVPSIFLLTSDVDIAPNSGEVSSYKWVPLKELLNDNNRSTYSRERDGKREALPSISVDGYIIWGLTYGIISAMLK